MPVWDCGRSPREAAARGRTQRIRRYPDRCQGHDVRSTRGPRPLPRGPIHQLAGRRPAHGEGASC